ncbi:hypothetical protein L6452_32678 [Arctium lappa]|uniref:Uncharacterized protein n=1 Tax=Arctium lappa TaxID=4217 RepID=A0ACB8Z5B1_ARCLA|nr:hypothetical protein L6452_32678 [Arctium lappa]
MLAMQFRTVGEMVSEDGKGADTRGKENAPTGNTPLHVKAPLVTSLVKTFRTQTKAKRGCPIDPVVVKQSNRFEVLSSIETDESNAAREDLNVQVEGSNARGEKEEHDTTMEVDQNSIPSKSC